MQLIISATGPAPSDAVDPRFGRAHCFLRYDAETDTYETLENAQADAAHGAGVQAAQTVAQAGATALLTGACGPKAFQILTAAGIEVYSGFEGSVADAVAAWKRGELQPLAAPDGKALH